MLNTKVYINNIFQIRHPNYYKIEFIILSNTNNISTVSNFVTNVPMFLCYLCESDIMKCRSLKWRMEQIQICGYFTNNFL